MTFYVAKDVPAARRVYRSLLRSARGLPHMPNILRRHGNVVILWNVDGFLVPDWLWRTTTTCLA